MTIQGDDRLQLIRRLHAFTKAGMADCKRALEETSGDYFQAACRLLSPDAFRQMDRAFLVRGMCGQAVLNPVTAEEREIMSRLREHFAMLAARPHHVVFSTETLPFLLLREPSTFHRLTAPDGASFLEQLWNATGSDLREEFRLPCDGMRLTAVHLRPGLQAAVIEMPKPASPQEADFIVVRHHSSRLRWFRAAETVRYFLVQEPLQTPDWNHVIVHEVVAKSRDLAVKKRLARDNIHTTPERLAGFIAEIW